MASRTRSELLRHIAQVKKDTEQLERNPDYNSSVVARATKRMARVDSLPPEFRALVHEFGLELVQEFMDHRVRLTSIKAPDRMRARLVS